MVLLITLYNPTGEAGHQGGGVAAPIGSEVFSEVLPYLEVLTNNEDEVQDIEVPDIRGMSVGDAKKKLKEVGLEISFTVAEGVEVTGEEVIIEQLPKPSIKIKSTNKVEVYF